MPGKRRALLPCIPLFSRIDSLRPRASVRAAPPRLRRKAAFARAAGCYPSPVQSFLFVFRQFIAWTFGWAFVMAIWAIAFGRVRWFIVVGGLVVVVVFTIRAISHVMRVRFVGVRDQPGMFSNRHRRH